MTEYPGSLDTDTLTVQLQGSPHEPERLLMIERPRSGRTDAQADGRTGPLLSMVRVREWSTGSWNAPPVERHVESGALLAEIERAFKANRRVSQEMYRVRRWLLGPSV